MAADIGIAADLPSAWDFTGDRLRSAGPDHAAPKGQRRQLFCEWIKQRGRSRSD